MTFRAEPFLLKGAALFSCFPLTLQSRFLTVKKRYALSQKQCQTLFKQYVLSFLRYAMR